MVLSSISLLSLYAISINCALSLIMPGLFASSLTIRNSVVVYLALEKLKNNDIHNVITGDGADELFAGYNFLLNKSESELQDELLRIKKIMHFPSQKIAEALDITVEIPFTNQEIIEKADTLPIDLLVNKKDNTTFGKWILRKAFENDLPTSIIWRQKTPMQDGSGTTALTKLFESIITDEVFNEKTKKIKNIMKNFVMLEKRLNSLI